MSSPQLGKLNEENEPEEEASQPLNHATAPATASETESPMRISVSERKKMKNKKNKERKKKKKKATARDAAAATTHSVESQISEKTTSSLLTLQSMAVSTLREFLVESLEESAATMVKEAWYGLRESIVIYEGKPVGTLAAMDSTKEPLNYNQVQTALLRSLITRITCCSCLI